MKFQCWSDLHLEFGNINLEDISVTAPNLILAGDIVQIQKAHIVLDFFQFVNDHYEQVFFIYGNHEFYGSDDVATSKRQFSNLMRQFKHITILDNHIYEGEDTIIIGSTLWSHVPDQAKQEKTNDYHIKVDHKEITVDTTNDWHEQSVRFLKYALSRKKNTGKSVVVCTHFAPLMKQTSSAQYEQDGRLMNHFFATDLSNLFKMFQIDFWMFGHTHFKCYFEYEKTIVCSNPRGYKFEDTGFEQGKVFDSLDY